MPCEGEPSSRIITQWWKISLKQKSVPLYPPAGPVPDLTLMHANGVIGAMSPSAVKFVRPLRYRITQSRVGALPHAASAVPNITPLANPIRENVEGFAFPLHTESWLLLHWASAFRYALTAGLLVSSNGTCGM